MLLQPSLAWGSSQNINGIFLNFNKEYLRERLAIYSEPVGKIIYRNLHATLNLFHFDDLLITEKSELVLLTLKNINI